MIIFLFGQDTYRSTEKLQQMKARFQREVDTSGSSMETIEGSELDLAYVRKVVLAPSLFTKSRFIVFKNILQSKPAKALQEDMISLFREYANTEKSNVLVFWEAADSKALRGLRQQKPLFDFLQDGQHVYELNILSLVKLRNWVAKRLAQYNARITRDALALMLQYVEQDMWRLANEVDKLGSLKRDGEITRDDIERYVSMTLDEDVYRLLGVISEGKTKQAIQILGNFFKQADGVQTVFQTLKWHITSLSLLQQALASDISEKEIAVVTKLHPYVVKKNKAIAQKIERKVLQNILRRVSELEIEFRRDTAPPQLLVTRLVFALSKMTT
ncbi:MAG: DNA polymerase III subunit delta [Patescibacteria group bacterium]